MKKVTRSLLSAVLIVCLLATGVWAAEPAPAAGAEDTAMQRWSECGVLSAEVQDPNEEMTREKLAALLVRLLKLPQDSGVSDLELCIAAGLLGAEETADASAALSQSQAMVILGKALGLEPVEDAELETGSDMDGETKGMLAAMVQAGIVTKDALAPDSGINLASVATLLDRAIGTYVSEDGATVTAEGGTGITLVVAKNVTVTGNVDTLVVASTESSVRIDGATVAKVSVTGESSTVVLNNAEVKTVVASGAKTAVETTGTTKVETLSVTGASAAVKTAGDTTVGTLTVSAANAAVETAGNTKVEAVAVTGASTTVKTADNTTVGKLEVSAANAAVVTEGKTTVATLAVSGTNTAVETRGSAKIESVTVSEQAAGTTVTAGSGTTIAKVENKAEGTTVTGSGEVQSVASSKNLAVETQGTQVDNVGDAQISITGKDGTANTVEKGSSASVETAEKAVEEVHVCKYYLDSSKAATCTEAGWYTYSCFCGESYTTTVNALGHSYTSEITTPAACTSAGVTTYTCSTCGNTYTEPIAALGHNYVASIETTGMKATITYTCSYCNDSSSKSYVVNPASVASMPSGVKIVDKDTSETGGTNKFEITLEDEEAFLYFTQVFDCSAAYEARKAAGNSNSIEKYKAEKNCTNLNMWYGAYTSGITVKMACDVDLNGMTVSTVKFGGSYGPNFDGDGHTISNATMEATSESIGFFNGNISVTDVTFDNFTVSATGCTSAAVVSGSLTGPNAMITDVTVKNSTVTGGRYTGAIAGDFYGNITGCTVENTVVSGQYRAGGIAGQAQSGAGYKITDNTLTNVTVKGDNMWPGKTEYELGKVIGCWATNGGECKNNSFEGGTTEATADVGRVYEGYTPPEMDNVT